MSRLWRGTKKSLTRGNRALIYTSFSDIPRREFSVIHADRLEKERWRWIPGYEGRYEVSDRGRVRSYCVCGTTECSDKPTGIVHDRNQASGHKRIALRVGGKTKHLYVHRLVLEAFVGSCPEGMVCAHLDGNPSNNELGNLAWVTQKENMRHKALHGTQAYGEDTPTAKLKNSDVEEISKRLLLGHKQIDIAADMGIDKRTVQAIRSGRRWAKTSGIAGKIGKHAACSGENHYKAKLKVAQVSEIKALINRKELSISEIARMYEVSHPTIAQIRDGITWRNVEVAK